MTRTSTDLHPYLKSQLTKSQSQLRDQVNFFYTERRKQSLTGSSYKYIPVISLSRMKTETVCLGKQNVSSLFLFRNMWNTWGALGKLGWGWGGEPARDICRRLLTWIYTTGFITCT